MQKTHGNKKQILTQAGSSNEQEKYNKYILLECDKKKFLTGDGGDIDFYSSVVCFNNRQQKTSDKRSLEDVRKR